MRCLEQKLRAQGNVTIVLDSEITSMEWDDQVRGNVGVVRTGYGGKKTSKTYVTDAIVFCNSKASDMMRRFLGYSIPVLPFKQYSLLFETEVDPTVNDDVSIYFRDRGCIATLRKNNGKFRWIAQGFADVTGQGQLFDERRVRNFKNYFCTSFDKKEVLNYSDLTINLLSVTPDDRPLVGNLRHHPNLFLNTGHG